MSEARRARIEVELAEGVLQELSALRRELNNFGCKSQTLSLDVQWIYRAQAAEAELAQLKSQPKLPASRQRHPVIVRAEAYAMFHGYIEQEEARLSEKVRLIGAQEFDSEQDSCWRQRNEKLGAAAVEREEEAWRLNTETAPADGRLL